MKNGKAQARLLDKAGNPKVPSDEAKAELARNAGEAIRSRLSFDLPDNAGSQSSNESLLDGEDSYTKALIVRCASEFERISDLIEALEARKKKYLAGGKSILAIHGESFEEWAMSLIPENIKAEYADNNGNKVIISNAREAMGQVAERWLLNLCKLSNNQLKGKPADGNKVSKPSMFDDPKKGKRLSGFELSNDERIKGKALTEITLEDRDGVIRSAILEIADAASLFNREETEKAGQIVKRLTDTNWDKRFGFDDLLVGELIQMRIYGLQYSACEQAITEAKKKQEDFLKAISSRAALKAESDRRIQRLKEQKEHNKTHNGLGGTTVQPSESAPNVDLADSQLNGKPDEVKTAITWKDKTERRLRKIATAEYEKGISDEDMILMLNDLSPSEEITEEIFNEHFSEENIKEYFAEVAFVEPVVEDAIEAKFAV